MFANKENVVLQNRNLGMKTPAAGKLNPKTPFKIPLNDENNAGTIHPKTGKKLFGGRDASAFVTPVGPRRPALAGKTTNVKARQLAPSGGKGKQVELVKSSQPVTEVSVKQKQVFQDEDYVPDVEYCPPTPVDLPYIPDDIQLDIGADLHNGNYMAGCHRAFLSGLDADGRSKTQRDMDANFRAAEAELDAETAQLLAEMKGLTAPAPRKPSTITATSTRNSRPAAAESHTRTTSSAARRVTEPKRSASSASSRPASSSSRPTSRTSSRPSSRGPSTTDSRRAAHLLSRPSTSASTRTEKPRTTTTRSVGSFAQPTASSHSRSQSTHRAAVLASKSTIGYTQGREVKKELAKPKRETAMEAMQRIQREDEERYGPAEDGGWGMLPVTESADEITPELEDNGIVEEFLEIVDDADFMLEMPEY